MAEALLSLDAKRFVLDGELIVPGKGKLSFDDLLQRIHPAASRVQMLSRTHPSQLVVFDFLADAKGKSLISLPLTERRGKLQEFASEFLQKSDHVHLSLPLTRDLVVAKGWLKTMRAGNWTESLAKRTDQPYLSGERAMVKVKNIRTADCVVGGFRYGSGKKVVGSLLLGLYDHEGLLNHVGFTSSIAAADRQRNN